jgi:DNA-binding CsgD family transcriptional regulator
MTQPLSAAELYVSVKTVEFHLGHIFGQLGIRSRKELITRIGAPPPSLGRHLGS